MLNAESDANLVRKAAAGDRGAFAHLSQRWRRSAHATALAALGSGDDAHDVAQEALVWAFLHLRQLRDPARFGGWLRHIVLSRCADYRRRRGTRALGSPLSPLTAADEDACAAEALAVRRALADLSDAHRTTVLLHHVGGWSHDEVARLMEVPVATVRSRLLAARRNLRTDLAALIPERPRTPMPSTTISLNDTQRALIDAALSGTQNLDLTASPEPWMPIPLRVVGDDRSIDLRDDITPERAALLPALARAGVPTPRLLAGPIAHGSGWLSAVETSAGENLLTWALGGTPHRLRLATERAFQAIDTLQAATPILQADPAGATLPRRTLTDDAEAIVAGGGPWLSDLWFVDALNRTRAAAARIDDPLVYTDYRHFLPNFVRVRVDGEIDDPFGWPGDPRLGTNPTAEMIWPWGHYGDPLLGLAMVWIYDCYPFVHTGFVEQFLWRRGVSRKEFAPRVAIQALRILQREVATDDTSDYRRALQAWADESVGWF